MQQCASVGIGFSVSNAKRSSIISLKMSCNTTFPTEINFLHIKRPGKHSSLDSKIPPNPACEQAIKKIHKTMNQAKGFTLIELLAVIAIIALLAALAFPFLKKAIDQSNRSKSMGNLRALHAGMANYAADYGHWPTSNMEEPSNPSQIGNHGWYFSLLAGRYIPVKRINRDGFVCLFSDALISPSNKLNQGQRWQWTSSPFPWTSSYAMPRFWGERSGGTTLFPRVPLLGGINNPKAIMLIECLNKYSGIYPGAPENHADWNSANCKIPRDSGEQGALALLANGSVISVSPKSHPDLTDRKYWDPRYTAP
jgi:general secretion pathway protein G